MSQSRLGRLASVALTAGESALGGVAESMRRFAAGKRGGAEVAGAFLSAENARRLAERLARLRGGAMKLGQTMSLQGADLLPAEFVDVRSCCR